MAIATLLRRSRPSAIEKASAITEVGDSRTSLMSKSKRNPKAPIDVAKYVTRWLRWTLAGPWALDRPCLCFAFAGELHHS